MKILRFETRGLHGYLNFSLDLNSNLVFLTGINGAGKTSAVRSITALLTPSFQTLAEMEYSLISVTVGTGPTEFTIKAQHSEGEVILSCSSVEGDMRIPILHKESFEPRYRFLTRQRDFYRDQEAIYAQNPILVEIDQLPTPMFLDLERRYQEGGRTKMGEDRHLSRASSANPLAGSLHDSLDVASSLAERAYRRYWARRTERTDYLKQEIVLAAFRLSQANPGTFGVLVPSASERKDVLRKITTNEKLIPNSLSQIGISPKMIEEAVVPFFSRVRDAITGVPTSKQLQEGISEELMKRLQDWSAIWPRVRQIDEVVSLIEAYNKDVSLIYTPIDRYLTSANSFLEDSHKQLSFDSSGNLQVSVSGDTEQRPITALSSGERQLVVILTHLAFNTQAKRANVLIIDEPELSLHLRWQERFVDAVTAASPEIQLILATHSPSIIRGRLESCIDVQEAHQSDSLFA